MTKKTSPKVSVCVVTYNQEQYIAQCLQSLVDQQTDFLFEVIVSDDCSTDKTSSIVMNFAERYPDIVKPIIHNKNIGAYKNFMFVHEQASGEYIAHMDGDDYALPRKLQTQSDFLDAHQQVNIVWHRMGILGKDGDAPVPDLIPPSLQHPHRFFNRSDLLRFGTVGIHSSKMYRSRQRVEVGESFPVIDFSLNVEQIGSGDRSAAILEGDALGVYRRGVGISADGGKTKRLYALSLGLFFFKYPLFRECVSEHVALITLASIKNKRWKDIKVFLPLFLRTFSIRGLISIFLNRHIHAAFRIPR